MAEQYDLIVIGTGTAASVAAFRCRAAGWRVAMVDHRPFGGTCALRGCDPKKVLVGAAEALDFARRLRGTGIGGGEPTIEWRELMAFKRAFTRPVPQQRERDFAKSGIEAFHGLARFRGLRTVEVEGRLLEGRFVLIAAGAAPRHLGIPGEEHLATSTDFLDLDELPKRIAMVGGGYIAAEFSHIAARAGARVTVIQRGGAILPQFDADLVSLIAQKSAASGIDLRLDSTVGGVERTRDGYRVAITAKKGPANIDADLVVHAAGRVPDLDALDLDAGGIERDKRGPKLNQFLQSVSNPAVYAAGDSAASGPPLTPVASYEGQIVARNMLEGNLETPNYLGVPSVVFTIPPLARVGLLESEARQQNLHFRVRHENTAGWYTARRVAEGCAGFKVLVEEGSERILGAHVAGPHAEDVINVFALAIRNGLTADRVKATIFAYPTAASDIRYMV